MKPLLRVGVPLWCLLISSALLKVCQTSSTEESSTSQTETFTTAATPIRTSANFTAMTSGLAYNTSTVPGTVNPPTTHTTPAAVTTLDVTDVTTSSVSLNWTYTGGQVSSFKVQWTHGTNILSNLTTKTSYTITNLTSGVRYNVTVSAVADGQTEGKGQTVSLYTRPGKVVLRSVDTNTSSISLDWTPPPGLNFEYRVEWYSGGNASSMLTVESSAVLLDLIPGTSYTIMITVVVGDNVRGEPHTFSAVTKPAAVKNLIVTDVTTSSVSLSWAQPGGNVTWYIIRWAGGENTTTETSFVITNLTPGSQYSISVVAVAGVASNEGDGASTVTFTRPEKPENITLTSRGTNHLSIRWSLLKGKFQYFRVNVSEAESGSVYYNETKADTADIIGLGPGRIFAITVSTVAGNFTEASEEYRFATFPNPPGSIISWTTNSSLTLEWATPALMDSAPNVRYYVTYQSSGKEMQNITTSVNRTELANLSSGTFYSITLRTIGIQNLESTAVNYSTCTRPNPVLNLVASPRSTSSLEVQWSYPQGAQTHYTYFVLGPKDNTTVGTNSAEILNLDPGTKYRIAVKTIAGAAECESTEAETHAYTMPQAVTNLTVVEVETMAVQLAWLSPTDYKASYSYLVAGRQASALVQNYTTTKETFTFPDLTPGESYHFDVFTVVEGVKSEVKSISSDTKPAPATNVTVTGSTTNLSVGWSAAVGHVVSYTVLLYRDGRLDASPQNLDNRTVNAAFTNRTPGVYYCVVVVSKTRSFETNSSEVCRATVPNPPGSIFVESQNIHFINFSWPLPDDMDHQQYNFTVSSFKGPFITKNNWFFLDELQSGSLYNISVATLGLSNYESVAVVAKNYTRPFPVHNLTEEQATTNAVNLSWEQLESKPHYSYVVQASNGSIFWSETVNRTSASVTGLIPGSRYSFTVISQTADGTQATPLELSSYTQPDRVEPSVSSQGSNSSLLVSWHPPLGRLEHYCILLNRSFPQDVQELQVANTSNHHIFGNLSAGHLYSVRITVHSGPKEASSGFVFSATFPNPPGPLDILAKTNNSIDVKWQEAPLMTVGSFHYRLSISPPGGGVNVSLTNTSYSFAPLLSGTPYNISVLTVGALGFESEEVQIYMVNTKPFNVKNLSVYSLGENDTTVVWDHPDDYKESYRYNVTWKSSESVSSNRTLKNTSYITDLVPGSLYHFFVTTETFDGTQADPQWISSCTDASPVSGLQCQGPNTKNATLVMSWDPPSGQYTAFQVLLNDNERISFTNTCCSHNESSLHHYTNYKLTVETQSCGQPSIPVSRKCLTGITDPPIVQDFKPLVDVTETTHNKFSIQIDPRLLNDTNGPVTHVGVLVTNESPGNTSTWRASLGKTYDEWKKSQAPVYLAAVKSISTSRSAGIHHTLQVGDESKWEGYTNGALIPGQTYHYAVVVFTDLSLENNLVNGEKSLVSSTSFSLFVVLHGDPVIGIAVGATLGIFFVLFVILLGFIFYWRGLSRKEETDIQIHSMRPKVSVAVRMEDYEVYYRKQKADSNCGFAEEFEDLKPVGTDQSKNVASVLENKPKNRYNNVLPYDSSRVKLSIIHGSPYDDYINANYMPGYNSRKEFIAAQGPLPTTVKDFWRMIWEKNVQTLVMLTRCNEQGRVKCEQYWDYGTKRFENINVTSVSDIPLEDWTIRDFDIKNVKTAETRTVRQFHFTAWPDHGVPETTELLISFRHLVREHMDQYSRHSPTVVHCSAGVGRTGTFIAIDRLIFQIERENIVDVYGIVHDLRMHRPLMVQTEDQYVFLNQCAMDIIRSRTGTNVDLIYQNTAALSIYENVEPQKGYYRYPDA